MVPWPEDAPVSPRGVNWSDSGVVQSLSCSVQPGQGDSVSMEAGPLEEEAEGRRAQPCPEGGRQQHRAWWGPRRCTTQVSPRALQGAGGPASHSLGLLQAERAPQGLEPGLPAGSSVLSWAPHVQDPHGLPETFPDLRCGLRLFCPHRPPPLPGSSSVWEGSPPSQLLPVPPDPGLLGSFSFCCAELPTQHLPD